LAQKAPECLKSVGAVGKYLIGFNGESKSPLVPPNLTDPHLKGQLY